MSILINIGYSWLPLLNNNRLSQGDFHLPVAMDHPPQNYSIFHPKIDLPNTKWVDGHKELFNVSLRVASSIHTSVS